VPGCRSLVEADRRRMWGVARLGVVGVVMAGACACAPMPITSPQAEPTPSARTVPEPTNCSESLTDPVAAQQALDAARPGDRLCIVGRNARGGSLRLERSGTPREPVQLVSDGSSFAGLDIEADNVVLEGFNTTGGSGIKARGNNITIRNNDVRGATDDGIRCAPCTGSLIENNTVRDADGSGVVIAGQRDTVRGNDIAGSHKRAAADADGVRFAGTNHRIENNNVHDISQAGYPEGQAPHPDCFQTLDSDGQASYGVTIQHNTCANVDAQCLLASGTQRHNDRAPAGVIAIQFVDNYCQSGAVQAVALEGFPNVLVKGNTFSSGYQTAVLARDGAVDVTVTDNILVGNIAPSDVDEASKPGFDQSGNQRK
jgi:Right handed beta helix region